MRAVNSNEGQGKESMWRTYSVGAAWGWRGRGLQSMRHAAPTMNRGSGALPLRRTTAMLAPMGPRRPEANGLLVLWPPVRARTHAFGTAAQHAPTKSTGSHASSKTTTTDVGETETSSDEIEAQVRYELVNLELSQRSSFGINEVSSLIERIFELPGAAADKLLPRVMALVPLMNVGDTARAEKFNGLFKALSKKGKLQHALLLYKRMRELGVAPNNRTLTALLWACVDTKSADLEAALRLFRGMQKEGIKPDTSNYNALLRVSSHAKLKDQCLEIYEEMKRNGVPCTFHTFHLLIAMSMSINDIDLAIRAFEEMVNDYPRAMLNATAASTLAFLVRECGRRGRLDDAFRLHQLVTSQSYWKDNVVAMSSLIDACCKAGDIERALGLFESMEKEKQIEPNVITYGIVIRALSLNKRLSKALDVYQRMCQKNLKPNINHFSALIVGCALENKADLAFDTFRKMNHAKVVPNSTVLTALVSLLTDGEDVLARTINDDPTTSSSSEAMQFPAVTRFASPDDAELAQKKSKLHQAQKLLGYCRQRYHIRAHAAPLYLVLRRCIELGDVKRGRNIIRKWDVQSMAPLRPLVQQLESIKI